MFARKLIVLASLSMAVIVALALPFAIAPTQAGSPLQVSAGNTCLICHEDLYYLHDTGKAYCLQDVPMACVDCHGGNPTALTKESAHFNRAAHPVINDDDKKCYQCHPSQAETRLETFRAVAGIPELLVALPCPPASVPVTGGFPDSEPEEWVLGLEALTLFIVAGLALVIFIAHKIRHG
jgi:hypothetical protein